MDVEWIILADAAEVVNNKLYLLGGGWDALTTAANLPTKRHCAVAAAFSVPWSEANRRHDVEIEIVGPDGDELVKVGGQIEVGRPPGVPLGSAQRVQMAVSLALPIRRPGMHAVIARVEGEERRRGEFAVVQGAPPAASAPSAA